MNARYLITLAMVLGLGTFAGCAGDTSPDKTGDDDDTVGDDDDDDDDDDDNTGTGSDTGGQQLIPAYLTMEAQFGVIGGTLSDFTDGTNDYTSLIFIHIGDTSWDYNDPNSGGFCTIYVPVGGTSGVLDAQPIIDTAYGYNGTDTVETDCLDSYTFPADFADPVALLVGNAPDWAIGVSGNMSATMQTDMEAQGISPADQAGYLGAYWNVPILTAPLLEAWDTYAYALDGGGVIGADLTRADVVGQTVLPDAVYISSPLVVIPF